MAEYTSCARCGKIFMRISHPVCMECMKAEEESFQLLRDYLDENPHNNLNKVSEDTGVPLKRILRYLKEGRLEMTAGIQADSPLKCERCGVPVNIGTMCDECLSKYNFAIQEMKADSARSKQGTGMHSIPKNVSDNKRR